MKTISEFIGIVRATYPSACRIRYIHPSIYIVCLDAVFEGIDDERRLDIFVKEIAWSHIELDEVLSHGVLQLLLLTADEYSSDYKFVDESEPGDHWLGWFASEKKVNGHPASPPVEPLSPRSIHFYGFKGGQARSSVLVMLAKSLADDGARVLVVDADVEAPSLDALFDVAAEHASATLMGVCGWAHEILPLARVYVGSERGSVDLIACRPRSADYDADFAGFLLGTTFDARVLESAARKIAQFAAGDATTSLYDFVLIDHRTGLAPSVLPLLRGFPGSTVVFARPDGMSRGLEHAGVIDALLRFGGESPGAFVTFSLDPKDSRTIFRQRHGKFIERLLESLSDALTAGENHDSAIDPAELEQFWLLWKHDQALLVRSSPSPTQLIPENIKALNQLREVLGVDFIEPAAPEISLSKSGARDQGTFILTPDFARLFSLESKILYVFGRKGTGKTRLVRELSEKKLGYPLLVAQDFESSGLQSPSSSFNALLGVCAGNYELFWWALLRCGLESPEDVSRSALHAASLDGEQLKAWASATAIEERAQSDQASSRRVYLIDGVETAVAASQMRPFVEALFRFLGTVQFSRVLSRFITIRLFLRSDLQRSATQNVEQQIEGSMLRLRWDRASILNFAVARLASLEWFRVQFPIVCKKISDHMEVIERGGLSEEDAEEMLLEVFPRGLERNKLKTTTFFATYFSDAGGESEAKASFYPRLFDGFLREMDERGRLSVKPPIKAERVESAFVLRAYDAASGAFIDEVKAELFNLLELARDDTQNRDTVSKLLSAFSGLKTPFVVDQIVTELTQRTMLDPGHVRDALLQMKHLGIFEDRPGYPGEWRTGRLYKSGLQMKYVR